MSLNQIPADFPYDINITALNNTNYIISPCTDPSIYGYDYSIIFTSVATVDGSVDFNGNFTLISNETIDKIAYIVVGGGGGMNTNSDSYCGGGDGGTVLTGTMNIIKNKSYPIMVSNAIQNIQYLSGNESSFYNIIATGGEKGSPDQQTGGKGGFHGGNGGFSNPNPGILSGSDGNAGITGGNVFNITGTGGDGGVTSNNDINGQDGIGFGGGGGGSGAIAFLPLIGGGGGGGGGGGLGGSGSGGGPGGGGGGGLGGGGGGGSSFSNSGASYVGEGGGGLFGTYGAYSILGIPLTSNIVLQDINNQIGGGGAAAGSGGGGGGAGVVILFFKNPIKPNICFPPGTLILTDQVQIDIERIVPGIHTIHKKEIVRIIKSKNMEKKLVFFEKDALYKNYPNRDISMSLDHKIKYQGEMMPAKYFVGKFDDKIKYIYYEGKYLYNVLMEKHDTMSVHNLTVETLHPNNPIIKPIFRNIAKK